VAEQFLDHPDVGSLFEHHRGYRVADQMAAANLANLRFAEIHSKKRRLVLRIVRGNLIAGRLRDNL